MSKSIKNKLRWKKWKDRKAYGVILTNRSETFDKIL